MTDTAERHAPMLEAALGYAAQGWKVVPLHAPGGATACTCRRADCASPAKHPRTKNGLKDATSDPNLIAYWWQTWPDANIGLRTGSVSGVVVVDIDSYNGGDQSVATLEEQHGPLPPTLTADTGGGGRHLVYAHPGGDQLIRNRAGLAPGVDIRGDGGYIVAPPSLHISGRRYRWQDPNTPIAPLPAWIAAPAEPDRPRTHGPLPPLPDRDNNPWVRAAFAGELDDLRRAQPGTRNHQLNESAFNLGQLVPHALDRHHVEQALYDVAISIGLGDREARSTIRSGLEAGMARPRAIPEHPRPNIRPPTTTTTNTGTAAEPKVATPDVITPTRTFITGGTFILDADDHVPALWGADEHVLWAKNESLILCGPAGVGKTTIAQQLALGLIGLGNSLLDLPITELPGNGKVLYLAADRPTQAARSMKRMVTPADREILDERLVFWKGPPPFDIVKDPERLCLMAINAKASVIIIDSLKDLAAELSKDETGSKVNIALQICLANDIDVCALHHQRKQQAGGGKPTSLSDVYGSTWITAGAGSVALIWGAPGDACVELVHLKQPAADVGPLEILHDHHAGRSIVSRGFDLLHYMRGRPHGATAIDVAKARFGTTDPNKNQVQKVRRQLDAATRRGLLHRVDEQESKALPGEQAAARWYLTVPEEHAS